HVSEIAAKGFAAGGDRPERTNFTVATADALLPHRVGTGTALLFSSGELFDDDLGHSIPCSSEYRHILLNRKLTECSNLFSKRNSKSAEGSGDRDSRLGGKQ